MVGRLGALLVVAVLCVSCVVAVAPASARRASAVPSVQIGDAPDAVAVSPNGRYAFVNSTSDDLVSVVRIATRRLVGFVPVGDVPQDIAFNRAGTLAFVVNEGSDDVSVIDVATREVVRTVAVGEQPIAVTVAGAAGRTAYVANLHDNTVSVFDENAEVVQKTIEVVQEPVAVAATRGGNRVYVASGNDGSVDVIRTADDTVARRVTPAAPNPANALAVARRSGVVVEAGLAGTSLLSGRTSAFGPTVPAAYPPGNPSGVAITPGGRYALVVNAGFPEQPVPGVLQTIDLRTAKVVRSSRLGVAPFAVAITPDGRQALVTSGPAENGAFSLLFVPRERWARPRRPA